MSAVICSRNAVQKSKDSERLHPEPDAITLILANEHGLDGTFAAAVCQGAVQAVVATVEPVLDGLSARLPEQCLKLLAVLERHHLPVVAPVPRIQQASHSSMRRHTSAVLNPRGWTWHSNTLTMYISSALLTMDSCIPKHAVNLSKKPVFRDLVQTLPVVVNEPPVVADPELPTANQSATITC